jgi:hypothetical protein
MTRLLNGHGLPRLVLVGLALSASAGAAQAEAVPGTPAAPLRLDAFAVNLSGVGRVEPRRLDIVIERWSSDAERGKLLDTLKNGGASRLLHALQGVEPRAGYIRTTTSLGWDIQYATESPLPDGGRRIVFATDRPMSFFEAMNRPRSADYEFMVGEIHLGKDGTGDGRLAALAKVSFDKAKNRIEIEDYGIEPVRLTQVTAET